MNVKSLRSAMLDNPVLTKELRTRMRGTRAYWIVAGYIAFLSLIMMLFYASWWKTTMASGTGFSTSSKIGREFFGYCIIIQVFLVVFITPALTSGALTIEREQQTLDFMMMTKLTPFQIVFGKLLTAVGFTSLLLTATLPVISVCFFLGGVSPQQIVNSYLGLSATCLISASLGIAWSSVAKSTAAAGLMTYLTLATPFLIILLFFWTHSLLGDSPDLTISWGLICGLAGFRDPFDSWNPSHPVFSWWDRSHFLNWQLPQFLLPAVVIVSITTLMLAIACMRISPRWSVRINLLRQATLVSFLILSFTFIGWRLSFLSPQAPVFVQTHFRNTTALTSLMLPVFLLQLLAPVVCTGELARQRIGLLPWLRNGFRKSTFRDSKTESGFAFVVITVCLLLGVYATSMMLIGLTTRIGSGTLAPQVGVAASGVVIPTALVQLAAVLLVWAFFAAAMGRLFSTIARSRYSAAAVHYVWTLFVVLGPAISLSTSNYQNGILESPIEWLALLNPSYQIINNAQLVSDAKNSLDQVLTCSPYWLWSIGAMLLVTLGCEWVTSMAQRYFSSRNAGEDREPEYTPNLPVTEGLAI